MVCGSFYPTCCAHDITNNKQAQIHQDNTYNKVEIVRVAPSWITFAQRLDPALGTPPSLPNEAHAPCPLRQTLKNKSALAFLKACFSI